MRGGGAAAWAAARTPGALGDKLGGVKIRVREAAPDVIRGPGAESLAVTAQR